ncbi:hypothetical protein GCM10009118_13920 [Wandonia haliotis]|uniref:Uncharacterized protein n=1 Tax=Wandonia haliotis TaxID=574963 RepID=A0ABN1MNV8_9FLAO
MNGNSLSVLFKKYSIPVILLVIGLALIILGVSNNQGSDWMMASSLLAISGVLSIIYVSGIIPGKISLFIGIPVALVAVYVLYQMGSEVVAEENKKIKKEEITNLMKQNLNDIKAAQIAYRDKYGKYASDWNKLIHFIKSGTIKEVVKEGGVPNRRLTPEERAIIYGPKDNRALDYNMTELEAYALAKSETPPADLTGFVRDTVEVSYFERTFKNTSYVDRRKRMGFPEFNADSLVYIPTTSDMYSLKTMDSLEYQGSKVPVIEVMGIHPVEYKGKRDTLMFGSLTSPNLSANWD